MNFRFRFEVNSSILLSNSRRSFLFSVSTSTVRLWVQRWDIQRAPRNRLKTRDGVMGWTWGASRWPSPQKSSLIVPERKQRNRTAPSGES
jgi:hypothetical protein